MAQILLAEGATQATPPANTLAIYAKTDNILYMKNPSGTETAIGGSSGTVTSVSVAPANGFSGTVATATTTPAITLSTSASGILWGNSGTLSPVTIGTNLTFSGGTLNATGGGGMTYPSGSGIAVVSGGAAWGTTLTAPSGTIVGTSDSQALTNKTYNGNTWTAGTGTLTIAAGKTLTNNNSITLVGTDATTLTMPAETASIGYLNIPQNSQGTSYTCVATDAGKHILHPSVDTSARTFNIPANSVTAYPVGTAITFINQNGAGVITITISTDTLRLAGTGSTGSRTLAANGIATAIKLTATEWIISGTGLT